MLLKEYFFNIDFVDYIFVEGNNRICDDFYNGKEMVEVSRDKLRSIFLDYSNYIIKFGCFSDN